MPKGERVYVYTTIILETRPLYRRNFGIYPAHRNINTLGQTPHQEEIVHVRGRGEHLRIPVSANCLVPRNLPRRLAHDGDLPGPHPRVISGEPRGRRPCCSLFPLASCRGVWTPGRNATSSHGELIHGPTPLALRGAAGGRLVTVDTTWAALGTAGMI